MRSQMPAFIVLNTIALFLIFLVNPVAAQAQDDALAEALKVGRCQICHAPDKKLMGPSVADIVTKFKGNPEAATLIFQSVREGSRGEWGPIPMMPLSQEVISDAQLELTVQWMLSP